MENPTGSRNSSNGSLIFGGILIVLGVIFLGLQILGSLFRTDFSEYLWPFFIIVPGATVLILGLVNKHSLGEALVIIGSIASMTGILLFFQNLTDLWASWAYAWALIAPTSVGLGLLLYGIVHGLPEKVRAGTSLATIGLVIFLVGGVFFELVIGINGIGLGRFGWPLLLIGLGVLWLFGSMFSRRRRPE